VPDDFISQIGMSIIREDEGNWMLLSGTWNALSRPNLQIPQCRMNCAAYMRAAMALNLREFG
jgi:hypothetical protein